MRKMREQDKSAPAIVGETSEFIRPLLLGVIISFDFWLFTNKIACV